MLVAVLAGEIIVALPKERALWRKMDDPNTAMPPRWSRCVPASAPRCIPTWRSQRC
jgi:hypothetical protein